MSLSRLRLTVLASFILVATGLTPSGMAELATDISVDQPSSGQYIDWPTHEVYWYQDPPGTVAPTGTTASDTNRSDQDGVCTYTGDWQDRDAAFLVGRCISLAVSAASLSSSLRVDVRELTGPTLNIRLEYEFLTDGLLQETSYPRKFTCTSGTVVRECAARRDVSFSYGGDAEEVCISLRLYELLEDGSYPAGPNLEVSGGCFEL